MKARAGRAGILLASLLLLCAAGRALPRKSHEKVTEGKATMSTGNNENIRPSRVAGTFYEGNPDRLRRELETRLARAADYQGGGEIVSAAVPHAGYY